ncbi:hypothetical protein CYL18_16250 [Pradoshia eiseniae]|uniref:DUF58 domain-containing protein n=1 Tax=Pradoshia eiseniae TaxID=2064768 RepID=A0A2S7MWI2_9BACI|nr:DUF58 domain-containing protein [Pradoshia eiseniae]PQD94133.1 hypothetical protein CYL18_16250 [Pradoshia eiseniae]
MMSKFRLLLRKWSTLIMLLFLLGTTFSYAMFQGGFVSWFLFYSFLPFVIYAWLIFLYPLDDFRVERVMGDRTLHAGDSLEMKIRIKRKYLVPIVYIFVDEQLPGRLGVLSGSTKQSALVFIGFKKELEFSYTIKDLVRGEHEFSDLVLRTGDLLGMLEKECVVEAKETVLVLPKTVPLAVRQLKSEYEHGQRANLYKLRQETAMVSGIRDYEPGDRMVTIDWKSSAKGLGLKSKNFEENHSNDSFLMLNGISEYHIFEEMVTFAASLAEAVLEKGMRVGVWARGGQHNQLVEVKEGKVHRKRIMYFLARLKALQSGEGSYAPPKRSIPEHASLIFITSELNMPMVQAYTRLSDGKHPLTILFFRKDVSRELEKPEQDAYSYAANHGVAISVIHGRSEWDIWKERMR